MATKEERQAEAARAGSNLKAMAEAINLTPEDFFDAVKRQCVTGRPEDVAKVTAADFVAFFHTARQYGLDPLRKEIQIIPTKHGPRVYVGFDGWMRVLVSHPDYLAHGWRYNWRDEKARNDLESVTCWIARKSMAGTEYAVSEHTEFMDECRPGARKNADGSDDTAYSPWRRWPVRMLAEKAAMQAVRFTFAMYVPDLDEVQNAVAAEDARDAAEPAAPPAQGPIAPAAPIGRKRAAKKADEPPVAALPESTDVPGQTTIEDFLKKPEPVPVAVAAPFVQPTPRVATDHGPAPFASGSRVIVKATGEVRIVIACEVNGNPARWRVVFGNGQWTDAADVVAETAARRQETFFPPTPDRSAPATLPAFDPAESLRVDAEIAAAQGDDLSDLLG